jgi:hypothetical protein
LPRSGYREEPRASALGSAQREMLLKAAPEDCVFGARPLDRSVTLSPLILCASLATSYLSPLANQPAGVRIRI